MDSTVRTPGWMVGLLIIFSLATAATFGLFLFRHAEKAAMREKQTQLTYEVKELRGLSGLLESLVPPLDNQIASRRVLRASLTEQDTQATADIERMVQQNQLNVKAIEEAITKQIKTYQDVLKNAKKRRAKLAQEETRAFANERD
ncbi:MAG TPA: hypothetical protein VHX44_13845, partial [Planctomycetota bacterium]|nr:hypothetical protein [Planctomycetota bacterium]